MKTGAEFARLLARGALRTALMRHPEAKLYSLIICGRDPTRVHVEDLSEWFDGPYIETDYGATVHRSIVVDGVVWLDVVSR